MISSKALLLYKTLVNEEKTSHLRTHKLPFFSIGLQYEITKEIGPILKLSESGMFITAFGYEKAHTHIKMTKLTFEIVTHVKIREYPF